MSNQRETENTKEVTGGFGGVNDRVADSAANPDAFQLVEGIIPWEDGHRRMFGKKTSGKFHGALVDNLAIYGIFTMPGASILYQTREGLFMDGQ